MLVVVVNAFERYCFVDFEFCECLIFALEINYLSDKRRSGISKLFINIVENVFQKRYWRVLWASWYQQCQQMAIKIRCINSPERLQAENSVHAVSHFTIFAKVLLFLLNKYTSLYN